MQRHIRKIVIFPLVFIYSLEIASGVKYTSVPFFNIFMHGNVFHLFLCCYCLWEMLVNRPMSNTHMLLVGLVSATVGMYLSPTPFQGTSGIIFTITGLLLSAYPTSGNYIRVAVATAICTAVQPSSWCVHIVPLVLGFVYYRILKSLRNGHTV